MFVAERDFLRAKGVPYQCEGFVGSCAPVHDERLGENVGGVRRVQRLCTNRGSSLVEMRACRHLGLLVHTLPEQGWRVGKAVLATPLPHLKRAGPDDQGQRASDYGGSRANHMISPSLPCRRPWPIASWPARMREAVLLPARRCLALAQAVGQTFVIGSA